MPPTLTQCPNELISNQPFVVTAMKMISVALFALISLTRDYNGLLGLSASTLIKSCFVPFETQTPGGGELNTVMMSVITPHHT